MYDCLYYNKFYKLIEYNFIKFVNILNCLEFLKSDYTNYWGVLMYIYRLIVAIIKVIKSMIFILGF